MTERLKRFLLVAALLAGTAALSIAFSSLGGAVAEPLHRKPLVRTVHHTRKIHGQAPGHTGAAGVVVVPASQPQTGAGSTSSSGDVDIQTTDATSDDQFESEDDSQFDGDDGEVVEGDDGVEAAKT